MNDPFLNQLAITVAKLPDELHCFRFRQAAFPLQKVLQSIGIAILLHDINIVGGLNHVQQFNDMLVVEF